MPVLSGCCFIFDLKVGTKIIGILSLIGALLNSLTFAGVAVMLVFIGTATDSASQLHHFANTELHGSHLNEDDEYTDSWEEQVEGILELIKAHIQMVQILVYLMLAIALVQIVTSSMLIHGVKHSRRGLLLPYLVITTIGILLCIIMGIVMFAVLGNASMIVSSAASMLVGAGLQVYFMLVVFSQYQALGLIRMHEDMSMK
ncbi:uncharacterized protein LOC121861445 [Homarus americanus]|uniref:uncharacterized protein LOC121861445 n=1 Tax=Homarus americanus TaxID=6706 RepID=UPI001C4485D4|nr:uncharacterized protein LOC121861445 [Homarus americanus]